MVPYTKPGAKEQIEKITNYESIFPLRLCLREHYLLASDYTPYPYTFWYIFQISGRLDPILFRKSLQTALNRNPLIGTIATGSVKEKTDHLFWVKSNTIPWVDWGLTGTPFNFPREKQIDRRLEPGIRVFIREDLNKTTLTLQCHHSCLDGVGAIQFIEDLFIAYHRFHSNSEKPKFSPTNFQNLLFRESYQIMEGKYFGQLIFKVLGSIKYFLKRNFPPLALPPENTNKNTLFPIEMFPLYRTFDRLETSQMRKLSHEIGLSTNDFLLRDLFLTLNEWNKKLGKSQPIRIGIPVNTRQFLKPEMPAISAAGIIFLQKKPNQLSPQGDLIYHIHREIITALNRNHWYYIRSLVSFFGKFEGGIYRLALADKGYMTTLFTNVGEVFRKSPLLLNGEKLSFGNLSLDQIQCVPPLRPNCYVSFAAITYREQISIYLNFDPSNLSRDKAEQILEMFFQQVKSSIKNRTQ